MSIEQLELELKELPVGERLRIARWLLDTVLEGDESLATSNDNPLLRIAGRFSGGTGNAAEQIEEILANEVNPQHGLDKQ